MGRVAWHHQELLLSAKPPESVKTESIAGHDDFEVQSEHDYELICVQIRGNTNSTVPIAT